MVDVPALLRAMISPSQQAVTISERVKITETIQDARIVAASPAGPRGMAWRVLTSWWGNG